MITTKTGDEVRLTQCADTLTENTMQSSKRLLQLFNTTHRWLRPLVISGLCVTALFSNSCHETLSPIVAPPREMFINSPTEMGQPFDADSSDDLIIKHFQYTVSYNPNLNGANWVAWSEDSAWYGPVDRCDCFQNDPDLPATVTKIADSYYSGSGYDRSHMLGSEARTRSDTDNKATFYFTNIIPQTPDLNRQTWYSLEKFCDSLCTKANKELYIVAGALYNSKKRIKGVLTIPDSCWKIVVVLDRGGRKADVTNTTPVYAVMMNNGDYTTANNDWRLYKTTVREIEQSTGYHLLNALPQSVQDAIETKVW